jgi:hypothetical protein
MKTGIIRGEPIADYHATDAVGHSKLEVFRNSDRGPARYHGQFIAKTIMRERASDAMNLGSAADALILERRTIFVELPDAYRNEKGEEKKFTMAANACKSMVADIEASGLIPLKSDDVRTVREMDAAVRSNETLRAFLFAGEPQITMRHKLGAFTVQVRPDWWNPNGPLGAYMLDLKTAEDMPAFLKNRRAFGYDRQAALYREVARLCIAEATGAEVHEVEAPAFFFAVVFKTAPIQAVCFQISDEDMALATSEVVDDLRAIKHAYETNEWPGVPSGVVTLPKLWRHAA